MRYKFRASDYYTALLAVVLFYYSYRYIFQWANDVTSGSYSDTPLMVQALKYILCLFLVMGACLIVFSEGGHLRIYDKRVTGAVVLAALCAGYSFFIVKDRDTLVVFFAMFILLLMCLTIREEIDFDRLDKLFLLFINVNMLYEFVQIVLYIATGRLPAIAWADKGFMMIRFGGVFDEPFALSLFEAFLLPYIFHRYRGIKRVFYFFTNLGMLVLTWTVTSFLAIFCTLILDRVYVLIRRKKWNADSTVYLTGMVCFSFVMMILFGDTFINQIVSAKAESIAGHITSLNLQGLSLGTFFGIMPVEHHSESGIIKLLFTDGAIFTLLLYGLGSYSVIRFIRLIERIPESMEKYEPVFLGMMYYQVAFLIGSFILPFPFMFFNMMIFSLFMGYSFVV